MSESCLNIQQPPVRSHPNYVVYVLKGGKAKYTLPDGTVIVEIKQ